MGNPSCIDDVPIKTSIYRGCPIFFPYVPMIFLLFVGDFSMFPRESIVEKLYMSSARRWAPNLTVFLPLPQMKSTKSTKQCEAVCTREHKASVNSDAGGGGGGGGRWTMDDG